MNIIMEECEQRTKVISENISINRIRKRIGTAESTTSDYCSLETE